MSAPLVARAMKPSACSCSRRSATNALVRKQSNPSTTTTTTMVSRHQRKKIISVRTNAVLLPMMTPVAIGSIDTDRIANAYESSSSLNRTHQIEVQRVFEVADAEMTMEQAPAMEAPAPAMEAPAMEMGMEAQDVPAVETAEPEMTVEQAPTVEAAKPAKGKRPALQKGGWLGPITDGLEWTLECIDGLLAPITGTNSYGYSILVLTLLVKFVTFPLTKKQIEGSVNMQALQPKVKELQAMYANDPEKLQMETARLYKEANFNPLAGCLPTFATLPVFIGLYRALSNASVEGLLKDGFYWIPSLGGPATIEMRNDGNGFSWLFPLVDGAPPIGWHDALSYMVLPVLLVISQTISQKIMQPDSAKSTDPSQQQSQAILKFLPFMIGYFSLNVPAGLTLYWFFNNIITTTQTVYLRKTTKPLVNVGGNGTAGNGGAASSQPVRVDYVPKRERRSGATIPKVAAPKVDVSNAISAEFTDFDDGPAKVKSALESEFGDFEDGPAKVQEDDGGDSRGSRKGSRRGNRKKKRRGSR